MTLNVLDYLNCYVYFNMLQKFDLYVMENMNKSIIW